MAGCTHCILTILLGLFSLCAPRHFNQSQPEPFVLGIECVCVCGSVLTWKRLLFINRSEGFFFFFNLLNYPYSIVKVRNV